MTPTKQLVPVDDEPQPVARQTADDSMALFERLARDPGASVEKIERLMALWERGEARKAEAAFNGALALMLPEIPTIIERVKTDKTSYAPLEDIIEPLRPVLARFGFSLTFRTEWPGANVVKVVGILTHAQGHSRQSEFQSGADTSGSKNAIQALGSAVAYGKRYTTKDLLCIVTREDDDGERTGKPEPPEGFDNWWLDMELQAEEGIAALSAAWSTSRKDYQRHTQAHFSKAWAVLKAKAAKVQR